MPIAGKKLPNCCPDSAQKLGKLRFHYFWLERLLLGCLRSLKKVQGQLNRSLCASLGDNGGDTVARKDVMDVLSRFRRPVLPLVDHRISLGCPILDSFFKGGIKVGMITELTGKSSQRPSDGLSVHLGVRVSNLLHALQVRRQQERHRCACSCYWPHRTAGSMASWRAMRCELLCTPLSPDTSIIRVANPRMTCSWCLHAGTSTQKGTRP